LITATSNRKPTATATGRLLGVLGVFWLNLVIAPCALAFGGEHDCPHCPPEQAAGMAAHHGHHEDTADAGCDTMLSGCDDVGAAVNDGRHAQPKLKDKAEPVPMAPPPVPAAAVEPAHVVATAADPPDPVGTFPPLHLLNCVFLD
jgi:hypothetical protein